MSTRARILSLVLFVTLLASAFYLRVLTRRIFFRAPAGHTEEVARTRLSEAALQSAATAQQTATLYFPSLEQETLQEEKRPISWAESETDRIRQVLLALIEGSHQGGEAVLPPSTTIRAVFLAPDGTAYLDFAGATLANVRPGIASESLAVYAIVNSLAANLPAVKRVKIVVQGQPVETLGGHADLSEAYAPGPARLSVSP
ncbi:MAG: GerMN domain-containing protein [Terriglobia bacterium]